MKLENLTVNERILIHLRDFPSDVKIGSTKIGQTQEGISGGVDVRINHVPRATKKLLEDGYIDEYLAHVEGLKRKRKVYILTEIGRKLADNVLQKLQDEDVLIRFADGTEQKTKFSDIPISIKTKVTASQLLLYSFSKGMIHESNIGVDVEEKPIFVSNLEDIPNPSHFLGRKDELETLKNNIEGDARITIIHGIKGIGKTSLIKSALSQYEGKYNILWFTAHEWENANSFFEHMTELLSKIGRNNLRRYLKSSKEIDVNTGISAMTEDLEGTDSIIIIDNIFNLQKELMHIVFMLCKHAKSINKGHLILITRERDNPKGISILDKEVGSIQLNGLERTEAFELMKMMGMDPEEFDRVHGLINGHPLALELVNSEDVKQSIDSKGLTKEELWIVKSLKAFDAIFD